VSASKISRFLKMINPLRFSDFGPSGLARCDPDSERRWIAPTAILKFPPRRIYNNNLKKELSI
jgi:hypothetical protein